MMIQYGNTTNFVVSYDSSFTGGGQPDGASLAQGVLDYCEYDLVRLSMLFGNIQLPVSSLPIQINLVPGGGGASNNLVNIINCYCSTSTEPIALPGLVVAEAAEIFMNLQAKGWVAAWSNGEALSRVCAQILYPSRAWLWSTGNSWLNGENTSPNAARSNWVDNVWHTDQDYVSIGCGSLFLNFLADQLNKKWTDIIQAGAPTTNTLAETANILGVPNSWQMFSNLITAYLPPGTSLPSHPTEYGPQPTDDPYPFGPLTGPIPLLYTRHNVADDGTSHTGSLSDSPDIILKNNPVVNPQQTFSTAASVNSDTESDPDVLTGQPDYVYLRVWNRGSNAANVFATVYWSPPATLVTPNLWKLIGSSYYPDVPQGSVVEVSNPGITWPADQLPGAGHYCFVSTVGNSYAPAPNPSSFSTFDDFVNYIYANNNITWRNFNVVVPSPHPIPPIWGEFIPLSFLVTGAWDKQRAFTLETLAELPENSRMALQVPHWIGKGLNPSHVKLETFEDAVTDPKNPERLRIPLSQRGRQALGHIELPAGTAAISHMLVHIPTEQHLKEHKIVIRQLYKEKEVGRITWLFRPKRSHNKG